MSTWSTSSGSTCGLGARRCIVFLCFETMVNLVAPIETFIQAKRRDALREEEGREGTEGLEGGGAAAGIAPKDEEVRLPTELDAVDDDSVKLEEMTDAGRDPRKR